MNEVPDPYPWQNPGRYQTLLALGGWVAHKETKLRLVFSEYFGYELQIRLPQDNGKNCWMSLCIDASTPQESDHEC